MSRGGPVASTAPAGGGRWSLRGPMGERFTVAVLVAMVVVLGYVRLVVLPRQREAQHLVFDFHNPMLDAEPGERVLFFRRDYPNNQSCFVVRPEGVVLRPHKGNDRVGTITGLKRALPYLACSLRDMRPGGEGCAGPEQERDVVLYALNSFGMPADSNVRVDSIRPRWMRWGDRDLIVYEIVSERFGTLSGNWTTYLAHEAPVAGLVKMKSLLSRGSDEVHYREIPPPAR